MISIILTLHIVAGSFAIIAGFSSLIPRKGSRLHIFLGKLFFYAMLCMAIAASYLAVFSSSEPINALIGIFTFYLVLTAKWTASNHKGLTTIREKIGGIVACIIFTAFLLLSLQASQSGESIVDGVYVEAFYVYTVLAALALTLDIKILIMGGVHGAQRIARHLWRMILALFIATASVFLGQPQVFPEFLQSSGLLAVPVILVVISLLFWIIRVYWIRRFKVN